MLVPLLKDVRITHRIGPESITEGILHTANALKKYEVGEDVTTVL